MPLRLVFFKVTPLLNCHLELLGPVSGRLEAPESRAVSGGALDSYDRRNPVLSPLVFLLMKIATSLSLSSESSILKSTRSLKTKTIHLATNDFIYLILFINFNSQKKFVTNM